MDKLRYWDALLSQYGVFQEFGRWIGWMLVKGLKVVSDMAETLVNEVYKLLDFTSYAGIGKFFNTREVQILLWILIAFSIFVIAWNLIFNSKEYKPKIQQQVCIMVIVICFMPQLFTFLNTVTIQAKDFMQGGQGTNLSNQIVADGVTDLKYIDGKGFNNYVVTDNIAKGKNGQTKNGFTSGKEKNVNYIDPTEVITKDSDVNSEDLLLNQIITTEDGNLVVQKIEKKKFLGLIDVTPWYFRYHIDFLSIYLSLGATIIAFFFTAWKVAKILFELAFHHLLAVFMSASDLSSGQRIKTVFKSLGSIYVVLMLLPVLMKLFALAQTYVGQNISNGFVKGFVLVALAFAMIDGPNIIERVLGVDAGIKSGFQTLASTFMVARSATAITKGAAHLGGSLVKGAAKAGSAAVGTAAGFGVGLSHGVGESMNNLRNEHNNVNAPVSNGGISEQADNQNNLQDNINSNNSEQSSVNNGVSENTNGIAGQQNTTSDTTSVAAQLSNNNMNNGADNSNNANENSVGAGIVNKENDNLTMPSSEMSDSVRKNLDSKGLKSPVQKSNNFNPHGVIGTGIRSYQSSQKVGEKIGGAVGKVAGKGSRKISAPKATPPKPINPDISKTQPKERK